MVSERELTLEAIRNAVRSADACGSDTASLQKGCLQFVLGEVARVEARLSAVLEGLRQIEVEMEEWLHDPEKWEPQEFIIDWQNLLAALRTVGEQRTPEEK